ncbi:MAG: DUF1385 domain-containing protein [Coriobacteriaceae bacterium]|jgi:uncharacterized protein YqhQ|nr:DUF1385 domain-containing protein [Coriobacteriaceae bacterium]
MTEKTNKTDTTGKAVAASAASAANAADKADTAVTASATNAANTANTANTADTADTAPADERQKSDFSRAFKEDGARKTHVGGQALLEGIMMRGKHNWAVAVREPEGGIYIEEHDLASGKEKNKWMYWPLVRGCRALVESLTLGFQALEIAAQHAFGDEDFDEETKEPALTVEPAATETGSTPVLVASEPTAEPSAIVKPTPTAAPAAAASEPAEAPEEEPFFGKKEMAISMVIGVALGVFLFVVAPAFVTNLVVGEYDSNIFLWNVVDGALRVAVFVLYLWLIGRMSDIKRMFGYHGAEHKAIHCYEHGLDLTPANARSFPRLHVRCGTAFLIMVMLIAIIVYTAIPLKALFVAWGVPDGPVKLLLVILTRILFLPVIAGISYEITVKWAGSRPDNPLVKVILWPGMQLQYLTTNEPDDGQIACAIAAMQRVLDREEAEAQGLHAQAPG